MPKRAPLMTEAAFTKSVLSVNMSPKIRQAVRAVMVDGMTWKEAAAVWEVHESGIMRAMRRIREAMPPYEEILQERNDLLRVLRPLVARIDDGSAIYRHEQVVDEARKLLHLREI